MTRSQRAQLALSKTRTALNAILDTDPEQRSAEQTAELGTLTATAETQEAELRAALVAEPTPTVQTGVEAMDPEQRERVELRGRSHLGAFLLAALQRRMVGGVEAEYAAACQARAGEIPVDLFEADRPAPVETRAATPAPSTGTGVTVAPVQPFVFAPSIAPRLGIDLPSVGSGGYSEMTVSTKLPAGPVAKGGNRPTRRAPSRPSTRTRGASPRG